MKGKEAEEENKKKQNLFSMVGILRTSVFRLSNVA
jgi:hypothetical protein